jgi:hypothetical protein
MRERKRGEKVFPAFLPCTERHILIKDTGGPKTVILRDQLNKDLHPVCPWIGCGWRLPEEEESASNR